MAEVPGPPLRMPEGDYGSARYWESLYCDQLRERPYEWYDSYARFAVHIRPYVSPRSVVLNIGCGSSPLAEELYAEGIQNVTSVDFSPAVIAYMRAKCQSKPELRWLVADITNMTTISTGSIDVIIDKGTTDAIMCSESYARLVPRLQSEAHRILVPGGRWIMISFSNDRFQYFTTRAGEFDELPLNERQWELESLQKEVLSTTLQEKIYYARLSHVPLLGLLNLHDNADISTEETPNRRMR